MFKADLLGLSDVRKCVLAIFLLFELATAEGADWIRAGVNTSQPIWGLSGGLQFAIYPGGFRGHDGGPRGLLRLGSPILADGKYDLVNFIAVEPVVAGRKGFSELERSQLEGLPGKRFWTGLGNSNVASTVTAEPGRLTLLAGGVEQLEVTVHVERFDNGAHVSLLISQRSDRPDEIRLKIHAEADSAMMENCTLTATMGNMARTRLLWLADRVVTARALYPDYHELGFAEHSHFPLDQLYRTAQGDALVAVTTDEEHPESVFPFAGTRNWHYDGASVTQYWRKERGDVARRLEVWVNGRYVYWQSKQPIPGGVAFENFELREPFVEGQTVCFGITRRTPAQLGFSAKVSTSAP